MKKPGFKVSIPNAPKKHRRKWETIVTKEFNKCFPKFKAKVSKHLADLILHGEATHQQANRAVIAKTFDGVPPYKRLP